MARLADMMQFWRWSLPRWASPASPQCEAYRAEGQRIRRLVTEVPVIVADNVCEYFYAGTDKEDWDFTKDFPSCVPPFSQFFVEMRRPTTIKSTDRTLDSTRWLRETPEMWGWFCTAREVPRDVVANVAGNMAGIQGRMATDMAAHEHLVNWELIRQAMAATDPEAACDKLPILEREFVMKSRIVAGLKSGSITAADFVAKFATSPLATTGRWVLDAQLITTIKGVIYGPLCAVYLVIDGDGSVIDAPGTGIWLCEHMGNGFVDVMWALRSLAMPMALTLSFMNCKNVGVEDQRQRPLTAREVKAGRCPLVTYKVLNIQPMRKILRAEGGDAEGGLRRALHICRGHFATYSEEKPLFGRHAGRFWIGAHVRGDAAAGVVVKDYKVAAPPSDG